MNNLTININKDQAVDEIAKVKSLNDLKELGSIDDIILKIEKIIYPLRIQANSYDELLICIKCLQENWLSFHNDFFVSKRQKYIYILLEHEGEKREELLGINDDIYSDPKKANRWYKSIASIIRADLGDSDNAKKAFQKLHEIYKDLTDDAAFGDKNVR